MYQLTLQQPRCAIRGQIDQKRAEGAATLEREIINSKLDDLSDWISWQCHDTPKNRVPRGFYPSTLCDPDPKSAAGSQTHHLYDLKQTLRDPCPGFYERGQAFDEDFPHTVRLLTKVFAYLHEQADLSPATRQIRYLARVTAMDPQSGCATERAAGMRVEGNGCDGKHVIDERTSCYL